ncbi:hypothetical protein Ocin01_09732 [Orchesella cincta]|uniref:SHSP domain-containing protein n=1 Tax=Orchesella cincta TaxID=48709 RepID=A0A1D2MV13_ORCCI|nr:hypothetical protein Ocin01_09732 [Orchesella cincta]
MSDLQTSKLSKSKSRNGQSKNESMQSFTTPFDANNNVRRGSAAAGASLLQKLNLEHLKHIPFNAIKPKAGASAKDVYIDYALDMVINNLIMSGHLDPGKAGQMRSPIMKSQIAAICDGMLPKKNSKGASSKCGMTKKATPLTRSKPKIQKWAVQPTALPITIITDQLPSQGTMMMHDVIKTKGSKSKFAVDALGNLVEEPKRKKSKKHKVVESATEKKSEKLVQPQPSSWPMQYSAAVTSNTRRPSSEVPSPSHSMVKQNVSSTNKGSDEDGETRPLHNVQFKGSDLFKSEDDQGKQADKYLSKRDGTVFTPLFPPYSENRNRSAVSTSPSGTKLQPSTVTSSTSISTTGGFNILIDMRGFSNDEISMEVEGRLLIFLASRNRKSGQSARKVTEIVDVPSGVSLENLKIGRRVDGYVIVEEYESEH